MQENWLFCSNFKIVLNLAICYLFQTRINDMMYLHVHRFAIFIGYQFLLYYGEVSETDMENITISNYTRPSGNISVSFVDLAFISTPNQL